MKRSFRFCLLSLWAAAASFAQVSSNRFIVQMSEEPVARYALRQSPGRRPALSAFRSQSSRIQSQHAKLRAAVEARPNARVISEMTTVLNAVAVEMNRDEALALANEPGVLRVVPSRKFHYDLDHALALSKVPEAFARIGGADLAGLGIKIGMIDSGIDASHPAFQDPTLPMPDGFPRANRTVDLPYTNNKVIVARSYAHLYSNPGDKTPRDRQGHGTATAMVAAGVSHLSPIGMISGVAPKAWLGAYNVSPPGANSLALLSDDVVLKALDDAVSDGMDVINISSGTSFSSRPTDDLYVEAVDAAVRQGTIIVISAGNEGSNAFTISSPGTAPDAITVGATTNDRSFIGQVTAGSSKYRAVPANQSLVHAPVTAPLKDVSTVGTDGLACTALPPGSLQGNIALILRGTCDFTIKMTNAMNAGAVAAVIYSPATSPTAGTINGGAVQLPTVSINNSDGTQLKQQLQQTPDLAVTITFNTSVIPNQITVFSSRGPSAGEGIKPDLSAVGQDIYSALPLAGSLLGANYASVAGTSFSAPLVSGALALIKQARPGLTTYQYRSLVINRASALTTADGGIAPVQQAGSGLLNVDAALTGTITANPTSVSFRTGTADVDLTRSIALSNLGTATDTYELSVSSTGGLMKPTLDKRTLTLAPGEARTVNLRLLASGLPAGELQGFVLIQGSQPGSSIRIPYWYAVPSGIPATVTVIDFPSDALTDDLYQPGVFFRVTDASGVPVANQNPIVTVVSGGGRVTYVYPLDVYYPGLFAADLLIGPDPGPNTFHIQAGDASAEFTITGH